MSQLTNYVDTLVTLAQQQGLSASNDIAYKVGADVTIILAFAEPVGPDAWPGRDMGLSGRNHQRLGHRAVPPAS